MSAMNSQILLPKRISRISNVCVCFIKNLQTSSEIEYPEVIHVKIVYYILLITEQFAFYFD